MLARHAARARRAASTTSIAIGAPCRDPAPTGLAEVLREGRAHALTITSSEGLDNLWALLDDATRCAVLRALPAFVPHPRIAAHARDAASRAIATAGADAGLIAGLLEWFASHPIETR